MTARPKRVGRYETIRPIASGGMATVYLGRAAGDAGFSRTVAIKVMHAHLAHDSEFVEMFLNEAHLAANLRHPNVVTTLDVAQSQDELFLVMEYIEGMTAQAIHRALKKQGRRMPAPIAIRIALDTLAGLSAAHELRDPEGNHQGLIHRDVSPQNIIVGVAGIARLVDFGIARAQSHATLGKGVKGKLTYMAPEQARAEPVDARTDIYGAGVVLWELLTGERMFQADNDAGLLSLVVNGPSRTARQVDPSIPPEIDAVCMRALSIDPQGRFASATAFADALEDAAARSTGIATPRAVAALVKELMPRRAAAVVPRSPDEDSRPSGQVEASRPSAAGQSGTSAAHAMISTGFTGKRRRRSVKRAAFASMVIGVAIGGALAVLNAGPPPSDEATVAGPASEAAAGAAAAPGPPPVSPAPEPQPPAGQANSDDAKADDEKADGARGDQAADQPASPSPAPNPAATSSGVVEPSPPDEPEADEPDDDGPKYVPPPPKAKPKPPVEHKPPSQFKPDDL